ncbi:MAG TPA: TerD family protein [Thermoanaerobaculia bacterium]|jgi:tellurium resistance protein TerD|nr:TerD family protein [Thermoanaerobaculia bacterium]
MELQERQAVRVVLCQGVCEGQKVDLDLSALLLGADGKLSGDDAIVFYGTSPTCDGSPGAVTLKGDLKEGADEEISIRLARIDSRTASILFVITSFSEHVPIDLGGVRGWSVRVLDERSGEELCRHDMAGDMSGFTSMGIAVIRREGNGWTFHAIEEPIGRSSNGLEDVVRKYCR